MGLLDTFSHLTIQTSCLHSKDGTPVWETFSDIQFSVWLAKIPLPEKFFEVELGLETGEEELGVVSGAEVEVGREASEALLVHVVQGIKQLSNE